MKTIVYPWQTCTQKEQTELEKWRTRFGFPILLGMFCFSSAHVAMAHEDPPIRENEPGDQYPDDWCTPYDGICDGPCDEIDPDCESDMLFEEDDEGEEVETAPPGAEESEEDVLDDCLDEEIEDADDEEEPEMDGDESRADELEPEDDADEDAFEDEFEDDEERFDEETPLDAPDEEWGEDECLYEHPDEMPYGEEEYLHCEGSHDEEYFSDDESEREADATIDINVNGCSKTTPAGMVPGFALLSALAFIRRGRRQLNS